MLLRLREPPLAPAVALAAAAALGRLAWRRQVVAVLLLLVVGPVAVLLPPPPPLLLVLGWGQYGAGAWQAAPGESLGCGQVVVH